MYSKRDILYQTILISVNTMGVKSIELSVFRSAPAAGISGK